jgi:quercetin dioxygenase-like cupin family protein
MAHDGGSLSVRPGEGETIEGPVGGPLTFKARGEHTGGALTVLENTVAPLEGPPLHAHANEDEAWYVLEGTLRFKLDGELSDAPAGTFVFVPRGVPHCFQNIGEAPARIMVLFTPAGMERFFDRFARLPEGASIPDAFQEIGGEVGMQVLGPPLAVSDPVGEGTAPFESADGSMPAVEG